MVIDKKNKVEKAIKVASFFKDTQANWTRQLIILYFMLKLEASLITARLELRPIKSTKLIAQD